MEIISSSDQDASEIIKTLKIYISNKSHVFLLIYMEGCGPCNATRPEWDKIKKVFAKSKKIVIADLDSSILVEKDFVDIIGVSPDGFPSMYYICGKTVEKYEDCNITEKDRSVGSFVEWIKSKTNRNVVTRKKRSKRRSTKRKRSFSKKQKMKQKKLFIE